MLLHEKLDKFYREILAYAGIDVEEDGKLTVMDSPESPIKDGEDNIYYLPYDEHLNRPDGKAIFHILNENFLKPESEAFCIYKTNLLSEINVKLALLMNTLISIGSLPATEQKVKSKKLIELFTKIGEVEYSMGDNLLTKVLPKAVRERGRNCFIDIFLKRNQEVDGESFKTVGRTNFHIKKELERALDAKEYRIYETTVRKKDILAYQSILEALFPNMEEIDNYSAGSDNMVFGYLDTLLKTAYITANRINEVIKLIIKDDKSSKDTLEELLIDMSWVDTIEDVYGMRNEINLINNQDDTISTESPSKLNVNNSESNNMNNVRNVMNSAPTLQTQTQQAPVQQQVAQPAQQVPTQPVQQVQQVQQPMDEQEAIRAALNGGMVHQAPQLQPMYQQPIHGMYQQPMHGMYQQEQVPSWVNDAQMQQHAQMQQLQQQQMMQQQMMQQQMMHGQGMSPQQNMFYQQPQQAPQFDMWGRRIG